MPRTGVGARLFRPAPEDPLIYSPHVRPAAHNLSMKSRVHPKYKTKYHVRNWASYEHALVRRGNLTVWLSVAAKGARSPLSPRVPPDHCSPRITLDSRLMNCSANSSTNGEKSRPPIGGSTRRMGLSAGSVSVRRTIATVCVGGSWIESSPFLVETLYGS